MCSCHVNRPTKLSADLKLVMCVGPNSSDVQGDLVVKFPSNEGSEDTVMVNSKKKRRKKSKWTKKSDFAFLILFLC